MDTRIALVGIIVEDKESTQELNQLLHEYGKKNVSIISVAVDAPQDIINALSGKLGRLKGISVKTVYSNIGSPK